MFAFAGAYWWTFVPIGAGALALAAWIRPSAPREHRALDLALVAALVYGSCQLIPIGKGLRSALSPSADSVHTALLLAPANAAAVAIRPLSLDPTATIRALAYAIACVLVFWSARTLFEGQGGVRPVCRAIAWMGLVVAAITFVQRTLTPGQIYLFWTPLTRASNPTAFGPFVNRNDLAAWLIMTVPLVLGHAVAHLASHGRPRHPQLDLEAMLAPRLLSLVAAVFLMIALVLALSSRSGVVGLGVGLLGFVAIARSRLQGVRVALLLGGIGALLLVGTTYANLPVLAGRLGESVASGLGGRLSIWDETWPIVRDFRLTGVGFGAYQRAMLVYQHSPRDIFFNHAHNEYLQLLVEGGSVLAVIAGAVVTIAAVTVAARLRQDDSALFWIRAGAASGIAAIAAQSLFDTGLRMPANAVLFGVVAAIAVHRRNASDRQPVEGHVVRLMVTGP